MQNLFKYKLIIVVILLKINFISMQKNCHEPNTCVNQEYDECNEFINNCVKTLYNESTIDSNYIQNSDFFNSVYNDQLLYKIKIRPFLNCKTKNEVKLNITFTNISWKSLYMNYTQESKNTSRYWIFCIGNLSEISSIHEYFIANSLEPNETFTLELRANRNDYTEIRKFQFFIPIGYRINENYNIDEKNIFLYVDVSDLNNIVLYIYMLFFNSCTVKVYKENEEIENEELESKMFESNDIIDGEIKFVYNVNMFYPGIYYFVVTPLDKKCSNGTCLPNYSPKIYIDSSNVIILQAVLVFVLLIIVPICICLCCYCIKNSYHIPKSPNILLISTAVHKNHSAVLQEFINCLKILDITVTDFSLIKYADPAEWCNNVFKDADFIVIIASPNIIKSENEIHRNVENIFINLITIELSKPILTKRFCVVKFPYSVGNNVYMQVNNFQQFTMTSDFNNFIAFVYNETYICGCNTAPQICYNILPKRYIDKRKLIKLKTLINEANDEFQSQIHCTENVLSNNARNNIEENNVELACSSFVKDTQTFLNEYNEKSEFLKISSVQESGFELGSLNLTGSPEIEIQKSKENNKDNLEIDIRNLIL